MPHLTLMDGLPLRLMRDSLWLLFAAVAFISLAYWLLNLASAFEIWGESNAAGLSLQVALFVICPSQCSLPCGSQQGTCGALLPPSRLRGWRQSVCCCSSARHELMSAIHPKRTVRFRPISDISPPSAAHMLRATSKANRGRQRTSRRCCEPRNTQRRS